MNEKAESIVGLTIHSVWFVWETVEFHFGDEYILRGVDRKRVVVDIGSMEEGKSLGECHISSMVSLIGHKVSFLEWNPDSLKVLLSGGATISFPLQADELSDFSEAMHFVELRTGAIEVW